MMKAHELSDRETREYGIAAWAKKPEIEYSVSKDLTSTLKLIGIDVWKIPA